MSARRWIILAAAVVIGLLAGGLVYNYVQGVEDDANEEVELVSVFVARQPIAKGTFGDQIPASAIEQIEVDPAVRPANAITSRSQITGKVAVAGLSTNQIIVSDLFVSQAESLSTFAGLLAKNEVAITISVDSVGGVAGLLVPGDYVNIMVRDIGPISEDPSEEELVAAPTELQGGENEGVPVVPVVEPNTVCLDESARVIREAPQDQVGELLLCPQARFVYQKVQILAIGTQRALQAGETVATNPDGSPVIQNSGLLTLAVPPEAAQWIVSLQGSLVLALVSPDYDPAENDLGPIPPTREFPAEKEDPALRSPYEDGIRTDPLFEATTSTTEP